MVLIKMVIKISTEFHTIIKNNSSANNNVYIMYNLNCATTHCKQQLVKLLYKTAETALK